MSAKTPTPVDMAAISVWRRGACDLEGAAEFTGLSRTAIYDLINGGRLSWSPPCEGRRKGLIPVVSLILYMDGLQLVEGDS